MLDRIDYRRKLPGRNPHISLPDGNRTKCATKAECEWQRREGIAFAPLENFSKKRSFRQDICRSHPDFVLELLEIGFGWKHLVHVHDHSGERVSQ